ncbi:MAG: pyridoxamine 5'-phosphate oxidase family protein [Actinomycetota bacterium]|nr:pyridoxamine 5'-phosphate oxidase family protein [Acidimicrobiales bacterium]
MSESEYVRTNKTEVKRKPDRGSYDRETVHSILDEGLVAHVGILQGGTPLVIPMTYGRVEEQMYLHGSAASRLLRDARDVDVCVTVTLLDGLVLARSLINHSMNYRSVVIFGKAKQVTDLDEKSSALDAVTEHIISGRVAATRKNSVKEINSTLVLSIPINEASAKIRSGPPHDYEEDMELDVWAGVIPIGMAIGAPEPDETLSDLITIPDHVKKWRR